MLIRAKNNDHFGTRNLLVCLLATRMPCTPHSLLSLSLSAPSHSGLCLFDLRPSCSVHTLFIFHIQCVSCVLRKLRINIESPSGHILKLRPVQSSSPRPAARTPRRTEPYLVAESLSLCTTLFNVISISASSHPKKPILHTTLIPPQPREILSSLKLVFIFIRVHMSYHCSALALGL